MQVVLCLEENGVPVAVKNYKLPKGVSPFVGLLIEDDVDHTFKVAEVMLQIFQPNKPKVFLTLEYVPYTGEPKANLQIMADIGWKISTPPNA